jgi:hypothetical protein
LCVCQAELPVVAGTDAVPSADADSHAAALAAERTHHASIQQELLEALAVVQKQVETLQLEYTSAIAAERLRCEAHYRDKLAPAALTANMADEPPVTPNQV